MTRRLILSFIGALALAACGQQSGQPERKEVVFSILSAESQASAVISMNAPITPPCRAGSMGLPTKCWANGRTAVISSPASSTRMPRNRA